MSYIDIDQKSITKALEIVGYSKGLEPYGIDITCSAGYCDAYLLVIVLSELIKSGSIQITFNQEGRSKQHRLDYFERLCESVIEINLTIQK